MINLLHNHRALKVQQVLQNKSLKMPTLSSHTMGKMMEEDDLPAPPPTPYGTPHTGSHLFKPASIQNICQKLDMLEESE